jgi:two-component system sensor histidine kinase BarA
VVLDLAQLRNVTLNDETLMREVVDALVLDASQQIEELRQAISQANLPACIRLAHNAYGACGNVGAVSMARLFGSMERHARDGDLDTCRSSIDELIIELEKLRREAESI